MTRRKTLTIAAALLLVLLACGPLIYNRLALMRDAWARRELDKISKQIGLHQRDRIQDFVEPRLSHNASLDGDTTIVTITVVNPNSAPFRFKEIILEWITLGKIEPREKATMPIKVSDLAPGASRQVVLHFDRVPWISDEVPVNRIDLGWAQQRFDDSGTWVAVVDQSAPPGVKGTTSNSSEFKGSFWTKGGPLSLDPETAQALKKRRDEGLKAKTPTQTSPPKIEPQP